MSEMYVIILHVLGVLLTILGCAGFEVTGEALHDGRGDRVVAYRVFASLLISSGVVMLYLAGGGA